MALFAKGSPVRHLMVLTGGDTLVALVSLVPTILSNPPGGGLLFWQYCFLPVVLFSSFLCEVYTTEKLIFKLKLIRSALGGALSFTVLLLFFSSVGGIYVELFLSLLFFLILQNSWQSLYQKSTDSLFFAENILVLGTGTMAEKVEKLIASSRGRHTFAGYVKTANDPVTVPSGAIVGTIDDIVELSKHHNAHAIVIALTERRGNLVIEKLVTCKLMGVRIMDYPSFFEATTGKIPVEEINPSWLIQSSGFLITPFIRVMKRIVDVLFASTLLLVILPLLPIVACGIKLTSKGPIFYFQKRVGVNGKLFTIFKFRSMADNAEQDTGASWAQQNDSRVTPIGAFMRKTRIDELPQLVNVLKGDMSFIGPRPERPEFVEKISQVTPYYLERHAVKPGITGWAQVMYPYGSSLGDSVEKLRYDLYYINNLSFFLEILIILETIKVVLFRRGGR